MSTEQESAKQKIIAVSLVLGMCFGAALGQAIFNSATGGVVIGMLLGIFVGQVQIRAKSKSNDN